MDDCFNNFKEIADFYKVGKSAVSAWKKKEAWPSDLNRAKVDKFFQEIIRPHRKGEARKLESAKSPVLFPEPKSNDPVENLDLETATIEDLELAIRRARTSEQAERLSKQVRALKVVNEIKLAEKTTMNTVKIAAEVGAMFHFLQTGLTAIPDQISPSLEGLAVQDIRDILTGRIKETIGELQRGLENAIGREIENASAVVIEPKPIPESTLEASSPAIEYSGAVASEPDGGEIPHTEPTPIEPIGKMGQ